MNSPIYETLTRYVMCMSSSLSKFRDFRAARSFHLGIEVRLENLLKSASDHFGTDNN